MDEHGRQLTHREYSEIAAMRSNVWEAAKNSNLYYKEMLRYGKLLRLLGKVEGRILDLGSGDGYFSWLLARKKNCEVVAFDIARNQLAKFQEQSRSAGIQQVLGEAGNLPFAGGVMDAVVASEILEHLPDYEQPLREVRRVLKQHGLLVLSVPYKERLIQNTCPYCGRDFHPNGHLHSFDERRITAILNGAGFEIGTRIIFRNRVTEVLQAGFGLRFGSMVRAIDACASRFLPKHNIYIAVRARRTG